jgi:hypothetical protein
MSAVETRGSARAWASGRGCAEAAVAPQTAAQTARVERIDLATAFLESNLFHAAVPREEHPRAQGDPGEDEHHKPDHNNSQHAQRSRSTLSAAVAPSLKVNVIPRGIRFREADSLPYDAIERGRGAAQKVRAPANPAAELIVGLGAPVEVFAPHSHR